MASCVTSVIPAQSGPAFVNGPDFSVIIGTRDRPELFQRALASVLRQRDASLEVVIVNDSSTRAFADQYRSIERDLAGESAGFVRFINLPPTQEGHGPCHALNTGVRYSTGQFICFLDDDDIWTDTGHLARAASLLREGGNDLLLSDQLAIRGGKLAPEPIWLEDLGCRLKADADGDDSQAFTVSVAQLLTATGFCHVNSTIISARLFAEIGGFDADLAYEGDRDFYLRAIDRANRILYWPFPVADHTVPDPTRTMNMSTKVSKFERRLCQFKLLHKAVRTARHGSITTFARIHRRYAVQRLIQETCSIGNFVQLAATLFRMIPRRRPNRLSRCAAL